MFATVLHSSEGTIYKDFYNLFGKIESSGLFINYNIAIFVLPSHYKPEVANYYLTKLFGDKPFVAFYSNFAASNNFFSSNHLVGMFITSDPLMDRDISCNVNGFKSVGELVGYLNEKNDKSTLHYILVPYPIDRFREQFWELKNYLLPINSKVIGALTGGLEYERSYPVITNSGCYWDGSLVVITVEGAEGCIRSKIKFKTLGPPFSFTSDGRFTILTIDNTPAAEFFAKLLKIKKRELSAEYLTAFPMLLNPEKNGFSKDIIRFPKEVVNGGVLYWGDIPYKGEFNFVYLFGDGKTWKKTFKKYCSHLYPVADFGLFFYCVGKAVFTDPQKDAEYLSRYLQIPFLMVGSYGEFISYNEKLYWLNGSTTFSLVRGPKDD